MPRKQMRQTPNLRYTARDRPQSLQRRLIRMISRGSILTFAGSLRWASSLAICFLNFASFAFVDIVVLSFESRLAERHAEGPQQFAGLVVVVGRRHNRDVHPLRVRDLVRVDFREDQLLADTHRVVAVAVERLRVDPAEVANSRQGDVDEPIEELIHAPAAKRNTAADFISLT